jgi:hypothetical protein
MSGLGVGTAVNLFGFGYGLGKTTVGEPNIKPVEKTAEIGAEVLDFVDDAAKLTGGFLGGGVKIAIKVFTALPEGNELVARIHEAQDELDGARQAYADADAALQKFKRQGLPALEKLRVEVPALEKEVSEGEAKLGELRSKADELSLAYDEAKRVFDECESALGKQDACRKALEEERKAKKALDDCENAV